MFAVISGLSSDTISIVDDSKLLYEAEDISINYIAIDQIVITSDEDLLSFATDGSGSIEDPYMIKDYSVYGLGVTYGIIIANVTKHFTIEHCRILSIYGVVIENLPGVNINITNNIILQFGTFYQVDMLTGIRISNCDNIIISQNNIESNYRGVDVSYASNVSITENNINGRSDIDNLGISFSGISLRETLNCTANDNIFNKGGFDIDLTFNQLQQFTASNNIMKGLEIGYFFNLNDLIIQDSNYSQIILFNCTNIIIEDLQFIEAFRGIHCLFSTNCKFSNNEFSEGDCGIKCSDSNNLLIEKNYCDENYMGIHIEKCDLSELSENKCSNTTRGEAIVVESSSNMIVENNVCSLNKNGFGIYLSGENITIINNICNYNEMGIFLDDIQDCMMYNNTLCRNGIGGGVIVVSGQDVVISNNLFLENEWFALALQQECRDIIIHHNSFINNICPPGTDSQALDEGIGNYWYHPDLFIGNFWSNKGMKRKYAIEGSAGSFDLYPLKDPIVLPDEDYPLKTSFPIFISFFSILITKFLRRKLEREVESKPFS